MVLTLWLSGLIPCPTEDIIPQRRDNMREKWTDERIANAVRPYKAWVKENRKAMKTWTDNKQEGYEDVVSHIQNMEKASSDRRAKNELGFVRTSGAECPNFPSAKAGKWMPPAHAAEAFAEIEAGLMKELLPKKGGFQALLNHRRTHIKKKDGKVVKAAQRFFQSRDDQRSTSLKTSMDSLKADLESGAWDGTIKGLLKLAEEPEDFEHGA
jgi:hypothetical protein